MVEQFVANEQVGSSSLLSRSIFQRLSLYLANLSEKNPKKRIRKLVDNLRSLRSIKLLGMAEMIERYTQVRADRIAAS